MRFEIFQLAVHRDAHRTRGTFHHRFWRMIVCTMQTSKLFETAIKNLLGACKVFTAPTAFLIQTRKLNTRPELIFKRFSFTASGIEDTRSLDDDGP